MEVLGGVRGVLGAVLGADVGGPGEVGLGGGGAGVLGVGVGDLQGGRSPTGAEAGGGRVNEHPLHVRVAAALGCEPEEVGGVWYDEAEIDAAEARRDPFSARPIPHYDTDWAATGPLIEKYGINVARYQAGGWWASRWARMDLGDPIPPVKGNGDTPLAAVCNLILALKAAGKSEA